MHREEGHRERADGLAHQDLARARLGADPRCDVHGGADVPAVGLDLLAGVDADPDPNRLLGGSPCCGRDRKAAAHRAAHGVEDDVEAVAFGLDLRAAKPPDLGPGENGLS